MLNITKLQSITNRDQLIVYLLKESNSYSNFILERINRDPGALGNIRTQAHHIIPSYCGGPNQMWNIIKLTIEEHGMAHQFLYENYNTLQDLGASQMIRGQLDAGFETIRQLARETMKRKNISFFNSDVQRELGRRPKNRRPYARNLYILAALSKGFSLKYTKTGDILTINPYECSSLVFVIDKLMLHPQMENKRQNWNLSKNKEKHYAISGLTRMLTGYIDKKSGKGLYSFMGWIILGINLVD